MNPQKPSKQERITFLMKEYYKHAYDGVITPNFTVDELVKRVSSNDTQLQQNGWFRKYMTISKKQKILDYGSGIGSLVIYLNKKDS